MLLLRANCKYFGFFQEWKTQLALKVVKGVHTRSCQTGAYTHLDMCGWLCTSLFSYFKAVVFSPEDEMCVYVGKQAFLNIPKYLHRACVWLHLTSCGIKSTLT